MYRNSCWFSSWSWLIALCFSKVKKSWTCTAHTSLAFIFFFCLLNLWKPPCSVTVPGVFPWWSKSCMCGAVGTVCWLSGQEGNFFSRATKLLGRVLQPFGRALTEGAGHAGLWLQKSACARSSSELQGLFLAQVCSILMIKKHKMAERL